MSDSKLRAEAPAFVPSTASLLEPTRATSNTCTTTSKTTQGTWGGGCVVDNKTTAKSRSRQRHRSRKNSNRPQSSSNEAVELQQQAGGIITTNNNTEQVTGDKSPGAHDKGTKLQTKEGNGRHKQRGSTNSRRHNRRKTKGEAKSHLETRDISRKQIYLNGGSRERRCGNNSDQPAIDQGEEMAPAIYEGTIFTIFVPETRNESNKNQQPHENSNSCWGVKNVAKAIKEKLHQQQSAKPENKTEESNATNLSLNYSKSGDVALTLLTPLSTIKNKKQTRANKSQSCSPWNDGDKLSPAPQKQGKTEDSLDLPNMQRRKFDITRLRDRWWDVLKNTPPPPETQEKRVGCNKDGGGNDDDDDDDSSTSTVSLVPTAWQLKEQEQTDLLKNLTEQPDSPYYQHSNPIHEAIRRDDEKALRALLKSHSIRSLDDGDSVQAALSPIELAVNLRRPELLRIILANDDGYFISQTKNTSLTSPIHTAVSKGYDECVFIFLDFNMSGFLVKYGPEENNPIHLACFPHASSNILPECLRRMNGTMAAKAMSQKNKRGQTPLHVACASGRGDLVEAILANCSYSLLSKILSVQDQEWQTPLLAAVASGSTDVVMSLLMWKGNNHRRIQEGGAKGHSALSWAVRASDVEMTRLLLEFSGESMSTGCLPTKVTNNTSYNLTHALHVAVGMVHKKQAPCGEIQLELVRVLVEAGANPCSNDTPSQKNCLVIATETQEELLLDVLLTSYHKRLAQEQSNRRRDPFLQKQPESFFGGLEQQEESERVGAIRQALLLSLYRAWTDSSVSIPFYCCALALYRSEVRIDDKSLERLKCALQTRNETLLFDAESSLCQVRPIALEACYIQPIGKLETKQNEEKKEDSKPYLNWSSAFAQSTWRPRKEQLSCRWLSTFTADESTGPPPKYDLELSSTDGDSFLVHSELACAKSVKLDAAVRFERMKRGDDGSELVRLQLPITSQLCKWFLQHLYHGSIVGPFPDTDTELCRAFIILIDFAEQYMCSSLAQEVEMRLLSPNPRRCYCCHCSYRHPHRSDGEVACAIVEMGESVCINSATALDVFAATMQFEGDARGFHYDILVSVDELSRPSWLSPDVIMRAIVPAMERLRGVAAQYIVCSFFSVTKDESFAVHFETGQGDGMPGRESSFFLLNTCLDKLAAVKLSLRPFGTEQAFRRHPLLTKC